jgi:hypothetical protein
MYRFSASVVLAAAVFILMTGCDSTVAVDPESELPSVVLGTSTSSGVTATIYADAPLLVGYNRIYFDLKRANGSVVESATIRITPIMTMTEHSHASPVYSPPTDRQDSGLFEGAAIFTMPTGPMGTWRLEVEATDIATGGVASFVVPVDVSQASTVRVVTAADDERYVLTFIEPSAPKVGLNDLVLALHRRESMMSFPPATDLRVEIEPWMPSMDHGSPNNVHPVHDALGLYRGRVNFNMSGDWRIFVRVYRGDDALFETYFDLLFS